MHAVIDTLRHLMRSGCASRTLHKTFFAVQDNLLLVAAPAISHHLRQALILNIMNRRHIIMLHAGITDSQTNAFPH